jgi:hypothetical protein
VSDHLHVVDGAGEAAPASPDSHPTQDAFQRHQRARATPAAVLDADGKVLRKLAGPSKLAGLAKGTRITNVWQRGEDDNTQFDIELENDATITVTGKQLADPRTMERRFVQASKRPMPWITAKEWKPAADAIVLASVSDDTTGSEAEETTEWLAHFLPSLSVVDLDDSEALYHAIARQQTFRGSDGRVYVRPPELLHHVVLRGTISGGNSPVTDYTPFHA